MRILLNEEDITISNCEAIVNAANTNLTAGGGVCGAIFKKAGYSDLQMACDSIGGCKTGYAVITPGFKLEAKYIIHAVGPIYKDSSSNRLLSMAYYNSLKVANENNIESIAFPSISTGSYRFPKKQAAILAFKAIEDFIRDFPNASIKEIDFHLIDKETFSAFQERAQFFQHYFDYEIIDILHVTKSIDFAIRPFYLMYLNGEITKDQLIQRVSLFGLPLDTLVNKTDKIIREIIQEMDDAIEKHLTILPKNDFQDSYIERLHSFWETKLIYDPMCSPIKMGNELDLLYFGKPPVLISYLTCNYIFGPELISKKAYKVEY